MGEIEKSTYKELLKDMNKVQKWLKSIGIETEDTRFEKSKNNCMVIKNYYENNNINNINKEMKYEEINETFSTCMDYISIYRNLSKFDKNHLPKRKIKYSLLGPFLKKDEVGNKGDNHARNILFELEMASLLLGSKIKVEGFDDVKFKFNSYKFYIECKRPLSNNSVKDNMDKAYNQLKNKLKDEKDRGIIAVSLNKVIGKEENIIGKILLAENKPALLYQEANLIDNFVIEHQNIWHSYSHPNIIGIFFRFNFMSFLKEENILTERHGIHVQGLYRTSNDEFILQKLVKQLDKYS
ncbi:hypothetical protein ES702_07317 [subsurface metagenome]